MLLPGILISSVESMSTGSKDSNLWLYDASTEELREAIRLDGASNALSWGTSATIKVGANVRGAVPSFFVLGPVKKTKNQNEQRAEMKSMTSTQNEDPKKTWAPISFLKLKECKTAIEKSTRTLVCLGSDACRRTETALAKRIEKRKKHWNNQGCKQRR